MGFVRRKGRRFVARELIYRERGVDKRRTVDHRRWKVERRKCEDKRKETRCWDGSRPVGFQNSCATAIFRVQMHWRLKGKTNEEKGIKAMQQFEIVFVDRGLQRVKRCAEEARLFIRGARLPALQLYCATARSSGQS